MFNKTKKMENFKFYGCLGILALSLTLSSCSNDDDATTTGPTDITWTQDGGLNACNHILFTADGNKNVSDEGTQIGNGDQEFVFTGKQTLKKGTYILKGWVYIADGAELTIEPGTIIKGDKQTKAALIAERGGKLIAQGTATSPIVFTSEEAKGNRRPGDWGGIILCGKAETNEGEKQIEGGPRTKFGGNDDADNSGVLKYVRIEFAGYPFQTDQEINGLTLGAVGSGTTIDHVQVSYSNDDSFEWFGGTVNCDHLIAYKDGTMTSIPTTDSAEEYSSVCPYATLRLPTSHRATDSKATTTQTVPTASLTHLQCSQTSHSSVLKPLTLRSRTQPTTSQQATTSPTTALVSDVSRQPCTYVATLTSTVSTLLP